MIRLLPRGTKSWVMFRQRRVGGGEDVHCRSPARKKKAFLSLEEKKKKKWDPIRAARREDHNNERGLQCNYFAQGGEKQMLRPSYAEEKGKRMHQKLELECQKGTVYFAQSGKGR